MLTPKQKDLLSYITNYVAEMGNAPSFDEMRLALGLQSKSGIHRLVHGLVERGYIKQLKQRARALELVKASSLIAPATTTMAAANHALAQYVMLPLYGQIAAGSPITAISDLQDEIEVPVSLLPKSQVGREFYALTVKGDSMVNAGILSGDVILVERTNVAKNGQIVVALVRQEEATLKRFQKRGNNIDLVAENPDYPTQTYSASEVDVQGHLVGLLRRY
jgi:repressor LexA